MKKQDIPDKVHELYEGEKKAVYIVNDEGKFEIAESPGWEAEVIALQQALDDINIQAKNALLRVRSGESSPLEYHMYAQRMDLPMLAQVTGYFKWRIKRHFKPSIFIKLKPKTLSLYAQVLGITVKQLKTTPND